jgi:hypothetical protein
MVPTHPSCNFLAVLVVLDASARVWASASLRRSICAWTSRAL